MGQKCVLFVGTHMDDIELGCGGTAQKFKQNGYRVVGLIVCTDRKRLKATERSARVLGYELLLGGIQEEELEVQKVYSIVKDVIKKYDPLIVFGHTAHDDNHHHRIVSEATDSASRCVPNLFHYSGPLRRKEFTPDALFTFFQDEFRHKRRALKFLRNAYGPTRYFTGEYSQGNAYLGQRAYEYEQRERAPWLRNEKGDKLIPFAEEFEVRKLRDPFLSPSLQSALMGTFSFTELIQGPEVATRAVFW